jgi:predicted ATPase
MEDKFCVYSIWMDSLYNRVMLDEAKELALDLLKKFKCQFPKNSTMVSLSVLGNIIGVKATMKSRNVSMLRTLNDPTRKELMKLLDRLTSIFYVTKDDRMPLAIFKSLNWTLKYGCCDYSSVTFATTGLILTGGLNDLQGGSKYGEQALILLERSKSRVTAARTMIMVYAFTFSWTKPLRSLLKPLLQGYDIGLQSG